MRLFVSVISSLLSLLLLLFLIYLGMQYLHIDFWKFWSDFVIFVKDCMKQF